MLRTAVIGIGHLGAQHARLHAALAAEGLCDFVAVCDLVEERARVAAKERQTEWTVDWQSLIGKVDAVSLAVRTEKHCDIACAVLEAGSHVLGERRMSR